MQAAIPEDIFKRLDELQIEYTTYNHPPVFTVDDSAFIKEMIDGGHTKNLFLRSKRKVTYLVVALEDAKIDLKKLAKKLEAGRFSFGSPERLLDMLGVTPGSVCPFSLINDTDQSVKVVLDKDMMDHEWVNYHPLINTMSTKLRSSDLLKFIDSCGHQPEILDLSDISPDE